jgi:UDP-GlcNAc3NAcA epimerase
MKLLTILGTRPQFIKAATLSREISKHKEIKEIIVHTGQHYDENMSSIFFNELKISKPNYFLDIGNKSHGVMTGQMMEKIEKVALKEKPDWIIVYGDTNSTLAGAIVASKIKVKLAHIEAGLRSFNMNMPEEINRILTDRVSTILFCPSKRAVKNLKDENFPYKLSDCTNQLILNIGDVMLDGVNFYKKLISKPKISYDLNLDLNNYILCTIHRAENTDNIIKFISIFKALKKISKDKKIIIPIHPRTKKIIKQLGLNTKNLVIIEPVRYLEMLWLINNCALVMTDSGGLQKEAFFFKKKCITLRNETEWVELVECGANILAGTNKQKILKSYYSILKRKINFSLFNLYGTGKAATNIIKTLLNH